MEYFNVLFNEVYKILFLLVPVLVSVAMIVWLDRKGLGFCSKEKRTKCCGTVWLASIFS